MGPMISSSMAGGTENRTTRRLMSPTFLIFFETDRLVEVVSPFRSDAAGKA
ncbi:MAG: hypothetical protein WCW53_04310 [Syntrophales bacterium]